MGTQFTTTVQHELTSTLISYLFVTAFEGGSNYWLHSAVLVESEEQPTEEPWYSDSTVYDGSFKIELAFDDPERDEDQVKTQVITEEDVQRGLDDLGRLYPFKARNIVEDNMDADDADAFLQVLLFEKIIFG